MEKARDGMLRRHERRGWAATFPSPPFHIVDGKGIALLGKGLR
jgi:hypothetical protein